MTVDDKQSQAIRRILSTFQKPSQEFRDSLENLVQKRNALVHEGHYGQLNQNEVNLSKRIFEHLLIFVIRQSNLGRSKREFRMLLDYGGVPKDEVKDLRKIVAYLLRN
jgi:uncharacterized protein YutE (UPF0331/DUF86 family)